MEAVQENEKQELLKEYFDSVDIFNDYSRAIELLIGEITGEKLSISCMLEELSRIARQQTSIAMELTEFGLKDYAEIWREYHKGEF